MQLYQKQQTGSSADQSTDSLGNKHWGKYSGANYAHGKADFIAKLQIALKECWVSEYWLELLIKGGYYVNTAILDQCIQIKKMLIASGEV